MRWSLVLSTFIAVHFALSFFCVALPILPQSEELERRAGASESNLLKTPQYRENAKMHENAYHVKGLGARGKLTGTAKVTKEELNGQKARTVHADKVLSSKGIKYHADHVFEVQMLHDHLKKNNIDFKQMKPIHQAQIREILNGPSNMALIPGSINQSKGQLIKHGMVGKKIKSQPVRDDYALKSYKTAHDTAGKLESVLEQHPGYKPTVTLQNKLHDTFKSAGLNPPAMNNLKRPLHPSGQSKPRKRQKQGSK